MDPVVQGSYCRAGFANDHPPFEICLSFGIRLLLCKEVGFGDVSSPLPPQFPRCESGLGIHTEQALWIFFLIVLLFICAYNAWVVSPPCPHPPCGFFKELCGAGHRWLMPIILATQEAEIRRIVV
jgi:hypothetical protein